MKSLYLIGSLRNPRVPEIAKALREQLKIDVFDDWFASGPEADDHWRDYEKAKGNNFVQALKGHSAQHVFNYDKSHLDRCDAALLVAPAGKSGHLELGYMLGKGKPGYILLDGDPDRFDVMYGFATGVFSSTEEFVAKSKPEELKYYTRWIRDNRSWRY